MRPTISSVFNVATFEPIPSRSYSTGNIDKLLESDEDEDNMRRKSFDGIVREPSIEPTDSPSLTTSVDDPNPQRMTKSQKKRLKKKAATTQRSKLEANQSVNMTVETDEMPEKQNIAVAPTDTSTPKIPSTTEVLPSPQSGSDQGLSARAKYILVQNRMKELAAQGNSNTVLKDAAPKFQLKNMAKKRSRKPSQPPTYESVMADKAEEDRVQDLLKSANVIPSGQKVKLYKSIDEIPQHTGGKIPVQFTYDSAKGTLIARWNEDQAKAAAKQEGSSSGLVVTPAACNADEAKEDHATDTIASETIITDDIKTDTINKTDIDGAFAALKISKSDGK